MSKACSLFGFKHTLAVAIAASAFCLPASGQVLVVDDSFDDGITNNGPGQIGFNVTSSNSALDVGQAPGPLDFATGDSGRTIHGLFAPQTLANIGDSLEVVFDFTTPDTIAFDNGGPSTNEDFRFGLFNTAGTSGAIDVNTGVAIDFTGPINTSSGTPNLALNGLAGFFGEIDNINTPGSDLGIRTNNVNGTADASAQGGQFLNSTSGFDFISGGDDGLITLTPNTDFRGRLLVELNNPGEFDITVEIQGAVGGVIDSHTDSVSIVDVVGDQVGVNTNTFDLLAFHATSGAFGGTDGPTPGSSSVGEPNNGIDISNVAVTLTAVPEPGSMAMIVVLMLGLSTAGRSARLS